MPDSGNFSTPGSPVSNASIGSALSNFTRTKETNDDLKFRYRVTGLFFDKKGNCTHLEYEDTYRNYGKSSIETTKSENLVAFTSNANIQNVPFVGEYIELFNGPEEYSKATDKSRPGTKTYWKSIEGSLNIWGAFTGDNINLDPTVPGQTVNTQMASLNAVNYNKSLMGMIPNLGKTIENLNNENKSTESQYIVVGDRFEMGGTYIISLRVIDNKGIILQSITADGNNLQTVYTNAVDQLVNKMKPITLKIPTIDQLKILE